ncbi:MAG: hydantoinase B/oxoprolinase family protein [Magnetococcus sp. DMHC-6]
MSKKGRWRFAVDRGGTFTDVVGLDPEGQIHTIKLLSRSPNYSDSSIEGIRALLGTPKEGLIPVDQVDWIRLGTTVATNALLERQGEPVGLWITQGFRDLLQIGDQRRPRLFDLAIVKPELLYQEVVEIEERIGPDGGVETPLNAEHVADALALFRQRGITSLAIVFLHAWKNPQHEIEAQRLAKRAGFRHISLSHQTLSLIQMVGRGQTTLVDAYLSPILARYVIEVQRWIGTIPLHFMGSSGTLLPPHSFSGKDAILSGPAGGVIGVAAVCAQIGEGEVIGFDMGGTSTDVCRFGGRMERTLTAEMAGIHYQAPMLRVETVAAGGGSQIHFDGHKLRVGPDSAGADPGPACYGLGGPATVCDANLVLGRIAADCFPMVFGKTSQGTLDIQAARQVLSVLAFQVEQTFARPVSIESIAIGILRIANEAMARPIKQLSVGRGYDLRQHALLCFGGAGGQHACGIAKILGMRRIRIHPLAGVLSAFGILMAQHGKSRVKTVLERVNRASLAALSELAVGLVEQLWGELCVEIGCSLTSEYQVCTEVDLRTLGTDATLTLPFQVDVNLLKESFYQAHARHYGFVPWDDELEVVHLRVEVTKREGREQIVLPISRAESIPVRQCQVWFDGEEVSQVPVYEWGQLSPGQWISGPALVVQSHTTVVVEPGFDVMADAQGVLTLVLRQEQKEEVTMARDPILLELFYHRFMGIANEMGQTLERTAHSVNMKERLDFSCAIFDRHGALIANAPHIPVHLGAMGETVGHLIRQLGGSIQPGDVYLCNDPHLGGSHLPDITAISPVFRHGHLAFFVASRGHHADIGGVVPGSMSPLARTLSEEGVIFSHVLVVQNGRFRKACVEAILKNHPFPARNMSERLSDIQAQIAANNKGVFELEQMCDRYGDGVVTAYMAYMYEYAALAMSQALSIFLGTKECWSGSFQDAMDGGQQIVVKINMLQRSQGGVTVDIDFSGSSFPDDGPLNAPTAVVRSAVLYLFRTLIQEDIPLNDGCLEPIHIHIPPMCLLNPGSKAAVSAGNVETSQRVVDVLCGALGIAAASQGTMNNFLFGDPTGVCGPYYETIAGGSGAVFGSAGASGVQVHMTNTRITDPEILEHRFPCVRLEGFRLRRGSGGDGRWRGGEGVERIFRFLKPLNMTIVSERRRLAPFGVEGGEPGAKGENWLYPAEGGEVALPGHYQGLVQAGDRLKICTPGGGGFGFPTHSFQHPEDDALRAKN